MAEIVTAMAMAHAPGVTGWLDSAPKAEQDAIRAGYTEMGKRLRAAKPDLIIGIANDHMLNLPLKNPPDFCVGTASEWRGPAEFFRDWLDLGEYHLQGRADLAATLATRARDAGVSVTASDELLFDDNWSVPLHYLTPDCDIPFVPIHMNCINPPVPGPVRSFKAGQVFAQIIRDHLPVDLRVALIGTGGLSHEPGGKRYFTLDEGFDRWFLALLGSGDTDRILQEATVERMEQAGGGGTTELMAWLAVMAAASGQAAETVFYVPSVEMRCGIGGVVWNQAA